MKYIDLDQLILPDDWNEMSKNAKKECKQALKEINQAKDLFESSTKSDVDKKILKEAKEKYFSIKKKNQIWSNIKDSLSTLSHMKCWYCESIQIRSDNAVDHFRPKNNVKEDTKHEGYWWLEHDYTNYRYSCTYCNSIRGNGGKSDYFPINNERYRANKINDDLEKEQPLLLDPCNKDDVKLIDFSEDGRIYPILKKPLIKKRVEKSVQLYNLEHPMLIEKRKLIVLKIKSLIKLGDECLSLNQSEPKKEIIELIKFFMYDSSEYSSFAKKIIMGYRDREWVESIILNIR